MFPSRMEGRSDNRHLQAEGKAELGQKNHWFIMHERLYQTAHLRGIPAEQFP